MKSPLDLPDHRPRLDALCAIFKNRLDQLDYPSALASGLPAGSGLIESGNRHVLQRRL